MSPTAVVMNMYFSGLGIARTLGERGIPVVGLSSERRLYGNYSRYARIVFCPDSRREPEALLARLLELGKELGHRGVIFPTRDDDVVFLDRFREELSPYFVLTIPESPAVRACLDKWQTYLWAVEAGVPTPKCWQVESEAELRAVLPELSYPCVMKPVEAHHWRGGNWQLVGARKALGVGSEAELLAEYQNIARAEQRVLLQEMVSGADDCLVIAACYLDRQSKFVAGFNTQKLVQTPAVFGTGCILQAVHRPELFDRTIRLLQKMHYTGIAEVEYKWDSARNDYQLIEINPRPWDQHSLGPPCGVDLMHLTYCEHAGMPLPAVERRDSAVKWVSEVPFCNAVLQLVWRRDPALFRLLRSARGKRIYAIWSWRDPLPLTIHMATQYLPGLAADITKFLWSRLKGAFSRKGNRPGVSLAYERHLENENSHR